MLLLEDSDHSGVARGGGGGGGGGGRVFPGAGIRRHQNRREIIDSNSGPVSQD